MVHYHHFLCGKWKYVGHVQESVLITMENISVDMVLSPIRTGITLQGEVWYKIFTVLLIINHCERTECGLGWT